MNPLLHPTIVCGLERHGEMPPVVMRKLSWVRVVLLSEAAAMVACAILIVLRLVAFHFAFWLLPIAFVASATALPLIVNRRLIAYVTKAQYDVCVTCGFQLCGLPEIHDCPECGTQYSRSENQIRWHAWIDKT